MFEERLRRDFAKRLRLMCERLRSETFPTVDDYALADSLRSLAEELGRPAPIRMEGVRSDPSVSRYHSPLFVVRVFGPRPGHERPPQGCPFGLGFQQAGTFFDRPLWHHLREHSRCFIHEARFLEAAWFPLLETMEPIEPSGNARRAIAILAANREGLKGDPLSKALGCEEKNLGRSLADAIEKGLVENPRDGYGYRLTRLGIAWAEEHLPPARDDSARGRDGKLR